ncbi:GNAT family N-acetyltransferase [Alterisphingorhabdus coralli]|uniref:GNAT family N-acetyltransferase n=1 Tax=Alterisphingorhabdus coralli TaxID=3071408 RepID=A0AA97F8A9_9SPHN|nr:GNAT family N-acetyltransferase [Parasphingorhabdus sp. SCSIO 66989]WOE75127.1 GNAT family N-acetyltransferase [Parasphingorhabdus sp. SCSIO 66989]
MTEPTIPVPRGHVATIVTHLEMLSPPEPKPAPDSILQLENWQDASCDSYLKLFREIGTQWLWIGRLLLSDDALQAVLNDAGIARYAVRTPDNSTCGMVELDFRVPGECEIVYLGLTPDHSSKGHGAWLIGEALKRAWRDDVKRVWLHTCTLDHPAALGFYCKHGFVPFKREMATMPDHRLTGHLPRDAAPQVPIIE